ncbi:hypothetical protein B296_00009351 [Ensete ventricosum]|uniref:Uncharacterized protein n=1 Tax=Ensete ventricosum TaxID=4639 RepID=A0A426ZET9_ENSVE|nr:hypothetical protein B296_00009351 [Ensete ventricosum]
MHRVDAIGNSPGVRWELAEGIGSLLGWHKGVRQKKTETHRKIIEGSRKACRERFAEGIMKLAGNTPEDRWKKTERLSQECQRLSDWREIQAAANSFRWVNRPGGG